VLPRILRRPARFFTKVFDGEITFRATPSRSALPSYSAQRRFTVRSSADSFAAAVGMTTALGFAVSEIEIIGHKNTSEVAVFEALELDGFTSLATLDLREAREALSHLPWVETVSVRKVYPGKLEVTVSERAPCLRDLADRRDAVADRTRWHGDRRLWRLRFQFASACRRPGCCNGSRALHGTAVGLSGHFGAGEGADSCRRAALGCPAGQRHDRETARPNAAGKGVERLLAMDAETGSCRATSLPSICGSRTAPSSR
jgi:hypothetical protein